MTFHRPWSYHRENFISAVLDSEPTCVIISGASSFRNQSRHYSQHWVHVILNTARRSTRHANMTDVIHNCMVGFGSLSIAQGGQIFMLARILKCMVSFACLAFLNGQFLVFTSGAAHWSISAVSFLFFSSSKPN